MFGGSVLIAGLLSLAFTLSGGPANAAASPQCNGIGGGGGKGIECTVEVTNNLDNSNPAAPVTSSTVTVTTCLGDANAALAGLCTSTGPITSPDLTTSVNQCNYAVNGGGATLHCTVMITNNVTGTGTTAPVTTNQCNNSLDTGDVLACGPYPSTTNPATAAVIECNDSANGGGSVLDCVVDPTSTTTDALPVTVNQCNNSAVGGGSTVTCRVKIVSTITAPPVPVDHGPIGVVGGTGGTTEDTSGTIVTPVAGSGADSSVGILAYTGTDPSPLIAVGAVALLLGGGLTILAAKRRKRVTP